MWDMSLGWRHSLEEVGTGWRQRQHLHCPHSS